MKKINFFKNSRCSENFGEQRKFRTDTGSGQLVCFKKLDFLIIIGKIAALHDCWRPNGFIKLNTGIDFEGTY